MTAQVQDGTASEALFDGKIACVKSALKRHSD